MKRLAFVAVARAVRRRRSIAEEARRRPSRRSAVEGRHRRDPRRGRRGDGPRDDALEIPGAPKPYHIAYKITEVEVNDVVASLGQTTQARRSPLRQPRGARPRRHAAVRQRQLRRARRPRRSTASPHQPAARSDAADRAPRRLARHRPGLQGGADPAARQARGAPRRRHRAPSRRAVVDRREAGRQRGAGARAAARDARRARGAREDALGGVPRSARSCATRASPSPATSSAAGTSPPRARASTDTRRASGVVIAATARPTTASRSRSTSCATATPRRTCRPTTSSRPRRRTLADTIASPRQGAASSSATAARCCSRARARSASSASRSRRTSAARRCPRACARRKPSRSAARSPTRSACACCRRTSRSIDDPTAQDRRRQGADRRLQDRRRGRRRAARRGHQGRHAEDAAHVAHAVAEGPESRTATRAGPPKAARSTAARRTCSSTGSGGVARKALEAKLVAAARAEGLKYGLLIKRFDDAAITGAPEFTRRELVQMLKTTDQRRCRRRRSSRTGCTRTASRSSCAARSSPRCRSARGRTSSASARTSRSFNFLASRGPQLQLRLTGGTDDGFVPSGGIECEHHHARPPAQGDRRSRSRARRPTPSVRMRRAPCRRAEAPSRDEVNAPHPRDRAAQPRQRSRRSVRRVDAGLHARLPGLLQPDDARRGRWPRDRRRRARRAARRHAGIEGLSLSGGEPLQQAGRRRGAARRAPARSGCRRSRSPATRSTRSARCRRARGARAPRRADRRPLRRRRAARDRAARLGEPADPPAHRSLFT